MCPSTVCVEKSNFSRPLPGRTATWVLSTMTTWSPVIRVIVSCPGLAVEGEAASDAWTVLSTNPTTTTPIPIFLPERT